jgi:hypothetical protein
MPKGLERTIIQSIRVPYSQAREIELLSFETGLPKHRIMRLAITEFLINRGFTDVKKSS